MGTRTCGDDGVMAEYAFQMSSPVFGEHRVAVDESQPIATGPARTIVANPSNRSSVGLKDHYVLSSGRDPECFIG